MEPNETQTRTTRTTTAAAAAENDQVTANKVITSRGENEGYEL